jgi:hypothetical protein
MKILVLALLVSSFSFSCLDPKNMTREHLEQEYKNLQLIITQKEQIIKDQQNAFDIIWKLNYGTQLERLCAKQDLERACTVVQLINKKI